MAEDLSHMNDVCKDLVEEVIEFEDPGELVESAINACKGRTEEVNAPAAYHQFPCNAEPIHNKYGARRGLLGTKHLSNRAVHAAEENTAR